jgi:hypothetical protein
LPPFWRELAAAVISPPTGFNRLSLADRFDAILASRDPAYYSRLQVGVSGTTQDDPDASTELKRNEALTDFSMDYGLPGKPGTRMSVLSIISASRGPSRAPTVSKTS